MSHIAFLNHSGYGHVIPTLEVVTELISRGHRVTYLVANNLLDTVAGTGAEVVGYDSRLVEVDLSEMVTADATSRMPGIYLRESIDLLRLAESHFGADRPDLIAFDTTVYHAGRILARKWDLPTAQCLPVLASNEHFSLLDRMLDRMADKGSLRHPALQEFFAGLTDLLREHGQSDTSVKDIMGQVEDLTLVFHSRSFQPAGGTFDDRFVFVGPCLGFIDSVQEWTPPEDGLPIVLISLGTSVHHQPGFFRMCVRAFAGLPWHVVMSVHTGIDPAELAPLPPNVEVRQWVPQLAVLDHAAVFISHAGLGSMMGALYKGKPVVVVPTSPEHKVNAQRIAELGLGRVVREENLSPERLVRAVEDVAADRMTGERVARMRSDILATGGAARAADAIETRVAKRLSAL